MPSAIVLAVEQFCRQVLIVVWHELLYSSILFLLIFALAAMFKSRRPSLAYGLFVLVLLRLILPPDLSTKFSARHGLDRMLSTELTAAPEQTLLSSWLPMHGQDALADLPLDGAMPGPALGTFPWATLVVASWLAGVICFGLFFSRQYRRYREVLAGGYDLTESEISTKVDQWRRHFRVRRKVKVVVARDFLSPFTLGIVRPVIVLPQVVFERMQKTALEAIIAHELAHIKRFDSFLIALQNLIQTVYFFHPVVWLTNKRLNTLRELICDRLVLQRKVISSETYGRSMLTLLRFNLLGDHAFEVTAAFAAHKRELTKRIQKLVELGSMKIERGIWSMSCSLLAGIILLPMAPWKSAMRLPVESSGIEQDSLHDDGQFAVHEVAGDSIQIVNPLPNSRLSAAFGETIELKTSRVRHHNGVDLVARKGTEIVAAAGGTVDTAVMEYEVNRGRGRYLIISHGSHFKTVYSHLDSIMATVGQQVEQGEVIATVGSTGRSTGPHLHFEVLKDGQPVDPASFLGEWQGD